MGRRQILDVNVVPDAGSIGRWVVVAEDRHLARLLGCAQNDGDQVSLRRVHLPKEAAGARDVEVAQDHAPQAISVAVPRDRRLNAALGLAVGVDRPYWIRLEDGRPLGHAVSRGSGAEHDSLDPGQTHSFEQVDAAADVLAEVLGRIDHRFPNEGFRGAVKDGVDLPAPEEPGHGLTVAVGAYLKSRALGNGGSVSGGKVVEHRDFVAGGNEGLDGDRPDITGAAGDEDAHLVASKVAEHTLLARSARFDSRLIRYIVFGRVDHRVLDHRVLDHRVLDHRVLDHRVLGRVYWRRVALATKDDRQGLAQRVGLRLFL